MTELLWWVMLALGLPKTVDGYVVDGKLVKRLKNIWEEEHKEND